MTYSAELQYLTSDQFKQKARAGTLPKDGYGIRKQFITEVKASDDGSRRLTFTISTAAVDRDNDRISVDGWLLANYRANPVVMWAHDYRALPVARSIKTWTEGGRLKSVAEFADSDLSLFADQVYRYYKRGYMSAVSVGFRPKVWAFSDDKDRKYGVDFKQQELLEYSAVPVPANADALVEARGADGGEPIDDAEARAMLAGMRRSLGLPPQQLGTIAAAQARGILDDFRRVMLGR